MDEIQELLYIKLTETKFKMNGVGVTYLGPATCIGNWRTHRCRNIPSHSWTPMMPKMKNTKKHSNRTLPNIGKVSNSNITNIRMPLFR